MMRKSTALLSLVASLFIVTTAAQASTYIAVEGTSVSMENRLDDELNPVGMRFRLGTTLSPNLDLEAHFGYGSDDRIASYDDFGTAFSGLFLKGYVPIGFNSAFYAMGGFGYAELSQTIGTQEFTDERTGFSYGFGLETSLTNRLDLTADYTSYVRDEGLFEDISAVSLGLKFYF